MSPMFTILIVSSALVGVAEHLVGLVDLLKTLLSIGIIFVDVGVVLLGQTAVGLAYVGLCGSAVDT